jgi:hypothetical protein
MDAPDFFPAPERPGALFGHLELFGLFLAHSLEGHCRGALFLIHKPSGRLAALGLEGFVLYICLEL